MTIERTMHENVAKLMPHISPYGVFEEKVIFEQIIEDDGKPCDRVLFSNKEVRIILIYLVEYGYAINRIDIQKTNYLIQLTDSGRRLKELGSIEKLTSFEKIEQDKSYHQLLRDKFLFWAILFGSVGTCISAIFDSLQIGDFLQKHEFWNYQYLICFSLGFVSGLSVLALRQLYKGLRRK